MGEKSIVEENLKRLRRLKERDLTKKIVKELTGMSSGTLYNRTKSRKFNYKSKEDVASLIEENRPILEKWPRVSDLEELLHMGPHVYRHWQRSETIREHIGAVKILKRVYFNPDWFSRIKTEADKYEGGLITILEASNMLGVSSQRLAGQSKKLGAIQPAGKRTMRFYPRSKIMDIKQKLDEIRDAKLLTSEDVSTELGARVEDVRKYIPPRFIHPISGRLLYDRSVLENYKDAVFVRCTSLYEILKYCERKIFNNNSVRRKISYLIGLGKIPSEKIRGKNSAHYLPMESEQMVRNVYKNLGRLNNEGVRLISINDAAKKIGLDTAQMDGLLANCGEEYLLTENKRIAYKLDVKIENRKVALRPMVPYVHWAQRTTRYLADPVVNALGRGVKKIIREASQREGKPFDGYWYGRLASFIKEEPYPTR